MKNLYLTLLNLVLASFSLNAQIPNPGFESGLSQWFTIVDTQSSSVSISQPGHNGSANALTLTLGNISSPNGGYAVANSGIVTYPGFVINFLRPQYLTGFVYGGGLRVTVNILKDGGNTSTGEGTIGIGTQVVSGSGWSEFIIPINYTSNELGRLVTLELSNAGGIYQSVSVDDLSFIYGGLGIEQIESLVSVHPNPTKDEVTLSVKAELVGTGFTITDNAGRVVLTDTFKVTEQTVNLSTFDNGVYFIRTDKESQPVKIIKQ
ncbi:T9SS type A sorting domain-containing protein [Crocinitomicaceae bacterium]|nr:T9SS type A sorting domain-containing protein [Crocinitomicaceae bacterium]